MKNLLIILLFVTFNLNGQVDISPITISESLEKEISCAIIEKINEYRGNELKISNLFYNKCKEQSNTLINDNCKNNNTNKKNSLSVYVSHGNEKRTKDLNKFIKNKKIKYWGENISGGIYKINNKFFTNEVIEDITNKIITSWKNSIKHNKNMINPQFSSISISISATDYISFNGNIKTDRKMIICVVNFFE